MKKIDIHIHPRPDSDPTLDEYVRLMDEHDVQVALVHATPEHLFGRAAASTEDAVLAACEKHPDRFYGSCHLVVKQ